jgi:hypothetical protein
MFDTDYERAIHFIVHYQTNPFSVLVPFFVIGYGKRCFLMIFEDSSVNRKEEGNPEISHLVHLFVKSFK